MLAVGPVMADKPEWADKGKDEKKARKQEEKYEKKARKQEEKYEKKARKEEAKREHFQDRHRVLVREYYGEHYRGGKCPPGLKKKHNGCEPPGQPTVTELVDESHRVNCAPSAGTVTSGRRRIVGTENPHAAWNSPSGLES